MLRFLARILGGGLTASPQMGHKNHRRRNPTTSHGTTWSVKKSKWIQRLAWSSARRAVRDLLQQGRYDMIVAKYPHHIRYDYW